MATQRVGIQFDFNANTKQAQTNLNALEKTMARLETRMQSMGAANLPDQKRSAQGRVNAQANLESFGEERIDLKTPLRQTELLTEQIRKGKMGWDDYGRAVKQNSAIVTQQLAMQTGSIKNVERAGKGFAATFSPNTALAGISQIEYGTARMHAFGQATKAVSQNVIDMGKNLAFSARQMSVSLTMPMAIVGGLAIKQFTDIDKQLTDITKVYDAKAGDVEVSTGRIRASMKDLASELSRTQGAEIKDTLDIAQFYAQQGKTGDELRGSTIQASRLMTLGDVDINDAQKTITTLTSVVGASTEELGKYVDYLNKVEDSTQLTMADFAKTLPTIAPLVKTFIPDDKDALMSTSASMMEASRRAGFEPKESMNAWKSMYGSFVRPAGKTEEVFGELTRKYGQEEKLTNVVSRNNSDPVQILTELSQMTKDWDTTDRGRLMTQLTGKWQLSRGLGIMQALDPSVGNNDQAMSRMGSINNELVNNPEQLADNSNRQMDLIRDSASNQLKQLKQDAQLMFADLGERIFVPVMKALGNVLGFAKTVFKTLSALPEPFKAVGSILGQLTFLAGPLLAAFAATKMLSGFAGKAAASFATAGASATRMAASVMGVQMKGSGKLESRDQSVGKIQDKDTGMLGLQMQSIIESENVARAKSVALVEEKNVKTRESINLQREQNRAMTGTITPTNSPIKDPKKDLKKYQAGLKTTQEWPMAIKATDIGSESFRRHAGRIGAPATNMAGLGLQGNKVFGSNTSKGLNVVHKTHAARGGIDGGTRQYIQKELDKINTGVAVRRSLGERTRGEIDADKAKLEALKNTRGLDPYIQGGDQPARGRNRSMENRKASSALDKEIAGLEKTVAASSYSKRGKIAGATSYGIDDLEKQRASLLKAVNGNHIQQDKIMTKLMAEQRFEANARRQNTIAIQTESKMMKGARSIREQAKLANNNMQYAAATGDTGPLTEQVSSARDTKLAEKLKRTGANIKTFATTGDSTAIKAQIERGKETLMSGRREQHLATKEKNERVWSTNTLRGGDSHSEFRGHVTPRDVSIAQKSPEFEQMRKLMEKSTDGADVASIIRENEITRADLYDNLLEAYGEQHPGADKKDLEAAARRDVDDSPLPTTAGLERERDMHMERMQQRADALEERQTKIAESSGKWASNISSAAIGFGIIGSLGSQLLGIQSGLLDGALALANGIGAIGMVAPQMMEKVVGSVATAGSLFLDKFDASRIGTKIGSKLGDTMGTTMSARMSKAFSGMGAMFMGAIPYLVAAAAALLVVKQVWDWHRKDSEKYIQNLKEANKSAELHAELLGYVRKESEDINDMSFDEATTKRADRYRENEDGKSSFVREMGAVQGNSETKIKQLNAILSQEAIKILDDGGSEADVRSMVVAALEAAGINDRVIIDGVTEVFKQFEVTVDTVMTEGISGDMEKDLSGTDTARSWMDQTIDGSIKHPFDKNYKIERGPEDIMHNAENFLTETAKEKANKWADHMAGSINAADTEESKAALAKKYREVIEGARMEAEGDPEKMGTHLGMTSMMFDTLAGASSNPLAKQSTLDPNYNKLKTNLIVQESLIGGTEQYKTGEEALTKYKTALEQIEAVHGPLEDEQKRLLYNVVASAGGMEQLAGDANVAGDALNSFKSASRDDGPDHTKMTPKDFISLQLAPDEAEMDAKARRVGSLTDALNASPGEFHKRWTFEVDVADQETIDAHFDRLKQATTKGQSFVVDEANRQFQDTQESTMKAIQNESQAAMKSIDAKQKASAKAFEARGKALDAQFKSENKALQNKHKEEQKAHSKQQKEEQKVYDKQQKERDKEFQKQQRDDQRAYDKEEKASTKKYTKQKEAESEAFNDSWQDRQDSVSDYYDNAVEAIEKQGQAEEKLEQLRARNSERERKRLEYLSNMANSNIDINVAVAGGNLDEAARISNSAATESTDYYRDVSDMEASYAAEDRGDSRGKRVDALGKAKESSMESFGEIREDAGDEFADTQELADEKREEELQLARDIYDDKKALEAEQYEEQKALEAERFAEKQTLESERFSAQQALEQERLQAAQEAQREALEIEKQAIADRHAAEREMIQETARQKEDGARRQFEASKRSLDMEMEALLADIPVGVEARKQWVKDVEETYNRHGAFLNDDFAPEVNKGMADAMVNAMDVASNQIASDKAWLGIGGAIGESLRDGALRGFSGEQVAANLVFGTEMGAPELAGPAHGTLDAFKQKKKGDFKGQGKSTGYARGGEISGPGTGTSDSIAAFLSNGEHVMTAEEVNKLGGHKAVERLRTAIMKGSLPAFATGGGVGTSTGLGATEDKSGLNVQVASTGAGTVADGGVLAGVAEDVTGMGAAFDETMTNTVAPAWQNFGDMMIKVKKDSIDPVLEGSKIALQDYADHTNQIMSANMNPAWVQFGQNLKMVKDTVFDVVMTDMKAGIGALSASISTAIANEIMPKWTEGGNHIRTVQDQTIAPTLEATRDATNQTAANFGTAADQIGVGWEKVKENTAAPVRYTIDTVFNQGLVGMWNEVAEKLDLEKFAPHALKFASGGVLPGYTPGRDVHEFSSPTGGRIHLSGGEAIMRPEWTRAVGGPSAVAQMNSDARSGKASTSPYLTGTRKEKDSPKYEYADGGVIPKWKKKAEEGPTGQVQGVTGAQVPNMPPMKGSEGNLTTDTVRLGRALTMKFPEISSIGGWRGGGGGFADHPSGRSLDVMTGDNSGGHALGDAIVKYIWDNNRVFKQDYLIWKQAMHYGHGNISPMPTRGSRTEDHYDHVHTHSIAGPMASGGEVYPGPPEGAGMMTFGAGAGSSGGGNPLAAEAMSTFYEKMEKLKEKVGKWHDAAPDSVASNIVPNAFEQLSGGFSNLISEQVGPLMGGGGSFTPSAGAEHWRGMLIKAFKHQGEQPLPHLVDALVRQISSESSGDPGISQQIVDSNGTGDAAGVGLTQAIPGTWAAYRDPTLVDNRRDPWAHLNFAVRYARDRHHNDTAEFGNGIGWKDGGVLPTIPMGGLFDRGGVAGGTGYMAKDVIAPERVLSPRQTEAFENLVPAMNRVAVGGIGEGKFMEKTNFDRGEAFKKMIARESQSKIDFTNILEKMTPILTQLTGHLKSQIIPGITGYANDLIKLETDGQRIDKISEDIIGAITGITVPEINTDMTMNVGGNVYGDAALNATLERWKQDIIRTVQTQQAMAQQAIGGK